MNYSKDTIARFRDVYSALSKNWSMWWDATNMQYAAMTALSSSRSPDVLADSIMSTAEQIKKRSGWFGELNSCIRFIVAALLEQHGDNADSYMDELERVRKEFRSHKIRRGGLYEIIAITILRLSGDKKDGIQPITHAHLERFKEIHSEMAKHQWWITSVDDFPACAILAHQPGHPSEICATTEGIYQALYANGFWRGNPLQSAANLLFLTKDHPASIASRFHEFAESFRARRVKIWQSEYDEVAVLTFTNGPVESVVDRVLQLQTQLRELKPRISKATAFNLACSMAFVESVQSRESAGVANAKAMIDMNAIIAAQQAAVMAACIASSVAASTAASSAG